MKTTPSERRRRAADAFFFEPLDARRMLAGAPWGAAAQLVGLDDLAVTNPFYNGAGQTIAVLDTGIDYTHPALGGGLGAGFKVVGGYDFVDDDADPMDTAGHGTAVAGVAAADEFESGGFTYRGIASGAKLVALRIAANTASVPLENIEEGLQWVLANYQTYGITVVNLSFGFGRFDSIHSDSLISDELEALAARGIAFVSSAGNNAVADGPGITYPAADPEGYSVGSVSASDVISPFSQRSGNLDLLAVGERVHSTKLGGGFAMFDGTSFAAPAVAGAFALARQVDSSFALADIASMLRASGVSNTDGDDETGATTGLTYRRLEVDRLVDLALKRKGGTTVDQAAVGNRGSRNEVEVDRFGVQHLVYYDDDSRTMRYAVKNVGGKWSRAMAIDERSDVGTEFSLELDSVGRPRLAYLDGPNGDLRFGTFEDAQWNLRTLDDKGVVGIYPSLKIGADDRMYLAYFRKSSDDLRVSVNDGVDGSEWQRKAVDTDGNVGYSANLVLDQEGKAAVVYGDQTRGLLKIARMTDLATATWSIGVVDATVQGAAYLSLAFNAANRARVSYYEVQSADLKFAAEESNGSWRISRVATKGSTGLYTNLRIDGEDTAKIIYWDRRTNALMQASGPGANTGGFGFSKLLSNGGRYVSTSYSLASSALSYVASKEDKLVISPVLY